MGTVGRGVKDVTKDTGPIDVRIDERTDDQGAHSDRADEGSEDGSDRESGGIIVLRVEDRAMVIGGTMVARWALTMRMLSNCS